MKFVQLSDYEAHRNMLFKEIPVGFYCIIIHRRHAEVHRNVDLMKTNSIAATGIQYCGFATGCMYYYSTFCQNNPVDNQHWH